MRRLRILNPAVRLTFVLLAHLTAASSVWAQDEHAGHDMQMGHMMEHALPGGWLMPPMDPNMPMLPGLEMAVPPASAWLPHFDLTAADFPLAEPSRAVTLADGDTLDLLVSPVRRSIRGREYLLYGYNNQYPGPFIRAERGSTVVIRVRNEIRFTTTVHWHGIRLDARFDGVPGLSQPPIEPGESFTYEVHVPDAGMFWYHPHVREDIQQDLGLYGNLLVIPTEGVDEEPIHREELLALDDLLMTEGGDLIPYGLETPTNALMGRYGTVMLTNGVADHRIEAQQGEVIRFHLTNVANARPFNVRFGEERIKLVGSDVGAFERESWVTSVPISPAERYSVDVQFSQPGTVAITNTIQAVNHFRGIFYPHVDTLALVTVREAPAQPDLGASFQQLRTRTEVVEEIDAFREHFQREPDHELNTILQVSGLPQAIVLSMEADTFYVQPVEWNDAMPMMNWLSTGSQVSWILEDARTGNRNEEIHWRFQEGDIVKIRIFNEPRSFHPMQHPIHIHGQRFLVVARDGIQQENLVWKDTATLPVGSTMDLLVEMSNPGDWMMHCHIAEHLSAGMHFHFTVEAAP
ncbi:MAG: multicopper oxidase family protein [Gemmatimonadota bacterium]